MAEEPIYDKHGNRTNRHCVQIYKDREGYVVELRDERGFIKGESGESLNDVLDFFNYNVIDYDMEIDSQKEIDSENKDLTLEDIVRLYAEEGDYLDGNLDGIDGFLERLKEEANIKYSYRNLISNSSGFLARAILRRGRGRGSDKVVVYIDYDGMNPHMVRKMETMV